LAQASALRICLANLLSTLVIAMSTQVQGSIASRIALFERGVGHTAPATPRFTGSASSRTKVLQTAAAFGAQPGPGAVTRNDDARPAPTAAAAATPSSGSSASAGRSKVLQTAAIFEKPASVGHAPRSDDARAAVPRQPTRTVDLAKLFEATAALEAAFSSTRDLPALRAAIEVAREAGAYTYKIKEYAKISDALGEVCEQLEKAMVEEWDSQSLDEIIKKATRVNFSGVALSRAMRRSAQLKINHAIFKQAMDGRDLKGIEEAIEQGKAHLEDEELADVRKTLANLRLAAAVKAAKGQPFTRVIVSLASTLEQAHVQGLEEERIIEAEQVLVWAKENLLEEVCDICFEDCETHAVPCCAREVGGGRMCDGCMARMLASGRKCPFCRGSMK